MQTTPTKRGARVAPSQPLGGGTAAASPQNWDNAFQRAAQGRQLPAFTSSPSTLRSSPAMGRGTLAEPLLGADSLHAPVDLKFEPPAAAASASGTDETWLQSQVKAILYGVINMIVVTPVMIGFAAIIFRHHAFHRDPAIYAQLVKLVLFSSAVHQTAFTSFSSLPVAIGQVQDAGLIFLSQIAGDVADAMADAPPEHMLATVLVTLSLSTALLGVALMLTGYWQLAGLVQYLPLPVVGGYLAFIGAR